MHFGSTPVEVLHTVLLGLYKFLTGKVMAKLSVVQRCEVLVGTASVSCSHIEERLSSNVTHYASRLLVGISKLRLKWLPSSWCRT